jgi:hypothetical protein
VLTLVGGKVVFGAGDFVGLAPPALPILPDWSPVKAYGGYQQPQAAHVHQCTHPGLLSQLFHALAEKTRGLASHRGPVGLPCDCFAF